MSQVRTVWAKFGNSGPERARVGQIELDSNSERARVSQSRQHCRLTICNELVELTNSETAAATPLGGGAKSLRSLSSLETGSVWRFLVN